MRLIRIRLLQKCIFYTYSSISIHSIRNSDGIFHSVVRLPLFHFAVQQTHIYILYFIDTRVTVWVSRGFCSLFFFFSYFLSSICRLRFQCEIALDFHSYCKQTKSNITIDYIKINLYKYRFAQQKYDAFWRWIVAFMRVQYHNRHLFKSTNIRTDEKIHYTNNSNQKYPNSNNFK